jgi:hypothetical protein
MIGSLVSLSLALWMQVALVDRGADLVPQRPTYLLQTFLAYSPWVLTWT